MYINVFLLADPLLILMPASMRVSGSRDFPIPVQERFTSFEAVRQRYPPETPFCLHAGDVPETYLNWCPERCVPQYSDNGDPLLGKQSQPQTGTCLRKPTHPSTHIMNVDCAGVPCGHRRGSRSLRNLRVVDVRYRGRPCFYVD